MRLSTLLTPLGALRLAATAAAGPGLADFDWSSIKPSRDLEYHACYDSFQCARLLVPLDWQHHDSSSSSSSSSSGAHDPEGATDRHENHTVALAMIKQPATVPSSDPAFGGTIFTNPGGPGGSGVSLVLRRGRYLRDAASVPGRRAYEVLSWDPRGVQFTTPNADCFGDLTARGADELRRAAMGPLDAGADALARQRGRVRGFGQLCEDVVRGEPGNVMPFLTTPSVARDMVEMLDKVEELRGRERELTASPSTSPSRLLSPGSGLLDGVQQQKQQQQPLQTHSTTREKKKKKDVARIQYWGFSYGSVLGNTFASMYPGRVGRMIIDGIVDADDYMAGTWLKNLQDTEKIVAHFYQTCFSAGASSCALLRPGDASWLDLKARVDDLVASLDAEPASVLYPSSPSPPPPSVEHLDTQTAAPQTTTKTPMTITGTTLLAAFRAPLYTPLTTFPALSRLLADAVSGNYTLLLDGLASAAPDLSESCAVPNATVLATRVAADAQHAILCADGDPSSGLGLAEWEAYVARLKALSPTLGAFWAGVRFACAGWTTRAAWRFTGPFGTPEPETEIETRGVGVVGADDGRGEKKGGGGGGGRPAAPLLFLSSRLDPVTPLRNAYAMSAGHPGSAVVVQDSTGHCASMTPSACTRDIVREYLASGTVPETGTECEADCDPWHPCEEMTALGLVDGDGDGDNGWEWGLI